MAALDQVFFMIMDLLNEAFTLVMPVVIAVFSLALGSALIRMVYAWFAGAIGNMMGTGIVLIVLTVSCLAFVWSAQSIVDGLGNFSLTLGSGLVGADTMTPDQFAPSPMWSIADGQADKILATKAALCTSTWECIKTSGDQLMLEVAALFIYAAFAFLIFEIALTAIGYKTNGLFALLFAPMAVLPITKSFAEGAVQGWINHSVKLVLIAMVSGIASQAFDLMDMPPKPVFDDIIPAVLMSTMIAFLAWQSRSLAASIISAAPQLSAQAISRGVSNVGRAITGGASLATSAAITGNREKMSLANAASNIAGGMQRAPGRIANAAAAVKSGDVLTKAYWDNVRAANANARGSGGGAGASGGYGGGDGIPRTGGAWDDAPTKKQAKAAQAKGVDIGGMTRGEASVALERAGMDPSWYGGGGAANGGGPAANGGGSRNGGAGASPSSWTARANGLSRSTPRTSPPPQPSSSAPASQTFAQSHTAPSSPASSFSGLTNGRQFMVPANQLYAIGTGGGAMGTGWQNRNRASVRKHAVATLTGQRHANAERMAVAITRMTHFGT